MRSLAKRRWRRSWHPCLPSWPTCWGAAAGQGMLGRCTTSSYEGAQLKGAVWLGFNMLHEGAVGCWGERGCEKVSYEDEHLGWEQEEGW